MSKSAKPTKNVEDGVLVVSIPITFQQRGGRKQIVVPPGTVDWEPRPNRCDNSLINAIVKAHRWRRLIETGKYGSAAELSQTEGINGSYLCRVLRLTLLAPDIVEAVLEQATKNAGATGTPKAAARGVECTAHVLRLSIKPVGLLSHRASSTSCSRREQPP